MLPAAPYDLSVYPHVWDCPQASIDRRHLFWMFDVLCAGRFQHALEIGCLHGAASTAFIEAINHGQLARATFCDIDVRQTLCATLAYCQYPDRIEAVEQNSVELLQERSGFDFVLIDGDHRLESVRQEVELLLTRRPVCIMAHDTNAQAIRCRDCEGPPYLKWRFQTTSPYLCLEDNAVRRGEGTDRGMFLATTSREIFEAARTSLARWGSPGE